ncbi:glycoside hydrolase family 130 protein [Thermococcus thermotolerans]|uniref:glycoside hydrolase family 130 protein n=1 Tax=Thermococcus thermotolerans TaxID=2969672 RepID=UPI0021586665|nr:glycoside hydrolase family 130 protein [Thermococcus thermotolerans]
MNPYEFRFEKLPKPVLSPSDEGFDSKNVYNPAVVKRRGKVVMLYRAETKGEKITGRIGLALSEDGINFIRHPEPVMEPEYSWESLGVEDPRVVRIGKTYYMTYTGYDGKTARLCIATSKNLLNWKKHGVVFEEFPAQKNTTKNWTKSGAMLTEKMKSGPFKGHYIMYFGDSNIWIAYSKDLLHWEYEREPVLRPRGHLVEPGPAPILTEDGILLIHSEAFHEDGKLVYYTHATLFDLEDPRKLIWRTEKPILRPTFDWELYGWVDNVVFAEAMIEHEGRYYLYYGGADRHVGLAIGTIGSSSASFK